MLDLAHRIFRNRATPKVLLTLCSEAAVNEARYTRTASVNLNVAGNGAPLFAAIESDVVGESTSYVQINLHEYGVLSSVSGMKEQKSRVVVDWRIDR